MVDVGLVEALVDVVVVEIPEVVEVDVVTG